jgi:hypothetical protein
VAGVAHYPKDAGVADSAGIAGSADSADNAGKGEYFGSGTFRVTTAKTTLEE